MKLIDKINALSETTKWKITIGVAVLAVMTVILCAIGGAFHFEALPIAAHDTETPETVEPEEDDKDSDKDKDDEREDDEKEEEPDAVVHTVFISCGSGGTADPSGNIKVKDWDSLTVNFIPNEGYKIESVTVDGAEIGAKEEYTLAYIIGDHSIVVSFTEIGEAIPEPSAEPSDDAGEYVEG